MNDLPEYFTQYLKERAVSQKTVRNYLSDLSHFLGWTTLKLRTAGFQVKGEWDILPHFTPLLVTEYTHFQLSNTVPPRTINRRLATLRQFGQFLNSQGFLLANPTENVTNVEVHEEPLPQTHLLAAFKMHLEKDKVSRKTIRNYVSDVRGFLVFLETLGRDTSP
ncbi:MAG: site-specific integrase [Patescibacteria group bacterium]